MIRAYLLLTAAWLILTLAALLSGRSAGRTYMLRASYAIFVIACVEGVSLVALRIKTGTWAFASQGHLNRQLFEAHPYLVVAPRKNARISVGGVTYTHNAQGFRGRDFPPKRSRVRVVAMGGSTTYGIAVGDDDTWCSHLERALGDGYEVFNFGVSGYTTAEHISQVAFLMPEYQPDVLLLNVGLNDLQNAHVKGLAPDYSDYHAPALYAAHGLCLPTALHRIASGRAAIWLLQRVHLYPPCGLPDGVPAKDDSPGAEAYAARLYRRNLETIVAIAKQQHVTMVLVPQVLSPERVRGGRLNWWIPYVGDERLIALMAEYNRTLQQVAEEQAVSYAREVLARPWPADDFADSMHFNARGNAKFAAALRDVVRDVSPDDADGDARASHAVH